MMDKRTTGLLQTTRRAARDKFREEVLAQGVDSARLGEYRRMERDYRGYARIGRPPPAARELAAELLRRQSIELGDDAARHDFEVEVTRMLAALYADFIALARRGSGRDHPARK
ncbi:MAG: hypothetical protein PVJ40_06005 [Gammaproteobacteria bacterium]|jgi:hypothetical protein